MLILQFRKTKTRPYVFFLLDEIAEDKNVLLEAVTKQKSYKADVLTFILASVADIEQSFYKKGHAIVSTAANIKVKELCVHFLF